MRGPASFYNLSGFDFLLEKYTKNFWHADLTDIKRFTQRSVIARNEAITLTKIIN